ncbi:hypothetical protein K469DRAFT_176854 [Zopfia rhizophila CBS 207.26]|uniref:Uncharacterized protein n=1 Tax=Zopfia rhizophila CBS 207.26 TaxID=1314779 RepID=A0A6A6E0U5_9PEZI|nr:hypothetical protein K469DRAFT_176854 [Zopfia rhizophila CBS 207.26]
MFQRRTGVHPYIRASTKSSESSARFESQRQLPALSTAEEHINTNLVHIHSGSGRNTCYISLERCFGPISCEIPIGPGAMDKAACQPWTRDTTWFCLGIDQPTGSAVDVSPQRSSPDRWIGLIKTINLSADRCAQGGTASQKIKTSWSFALSIFSRHVGWRHVPSVDRSENRHHA